MVKIPEQLLYSKSHEWFKIEDGLATIGITDYAQSELGDLVFVEAVPVGRKIQAGDAIGVVESVKVASDVLSQVSGEVVQSNRSIGDQPELVNSDPYESWFVVIRMDEPNQTNGLLDAASYAEFLKGQS